jgi:hypothetical protein
MRARLARRALLACAPLVVLTLGGAVAQESFQRVNGAVTYDNYPGLEAFLFEAIDMKVGLNITFQANSTETEGIVTAHERDGQFVAHRHGPDQAKILVDDGFVLQDGTYVVDGFYAVSPGGVHSGIPDIMLKSERLPEGASYQDIDIDSLQSEISD